MNCARCKNEVSAEGSLCRQCQFFQDAWDAGYVAFEEGKSSDENPHHSFRDATRHQYWHGGWEQSQYDRDVYEDGD